MKDIEYQEVQMPDGHVSVRPMPSPAELSRFYADLYFQQRPTSSYQEDYSEEEMAHRRLRADLVINAIGKVLGDIRDSENEFLEVGCGEGFMLAAAERAGFSVHGLDFSDYAVKKFHPQLADRVLSGDAYVLLDYLLEQEKSYTVCVLQNVLEHVIEPGPLLAKLRPVLAPNAVVVATVPNDFSRLQERARELNFVDRKYWICPPQHLHYFNIDNLKRFISENGFEILDSFGDFPIAFFTFHPGSNYTRLPDAGRPAHQARLDLLLAERGMDAYLDWCRALTKCGMGRNITVVFRDRRP